MNLAYYFLSTYAIPSVLGRDTYSREDMFLWFVILLVVISVVVLSL